MNTAMVLLLGVLLLGSALAVAVLRQPVHCALAAALVFGALAVIFVALGAEFVGLVQLLVYVGAVAILIVFVILLTRAGPAVTRRRVFVVLPGVLVAVNLAAGLLLALYASPSLAGGRAGEVPASMIRAIGHMLVGSHLVPLQAVAVLLTAALIGATLFVWDEHTDSKKP
jgi:NADH-quinone oxidoreductase subunit J